MFACAAGNITCPVVSDDFVVIDDLKILTSRCERVVFPVLEASSSPKEVSKTITLSGRPKTWCVTVSQAVNFNFTQHEYTDTVQEDLAVTLLVTKPGMDDIARDMISSVTLKNGAFFPITPVWTFELPAGRYTFKTTAAQEKLLGPYPFIVIGEMSILTSVSTL